MTTVAPIHHGPLVAAFIAARFESLRRAALNQACIDSLLTAIRDRDARIADLDCSAQRMQSLESDVTGYKALACAALENVAHLTERNRKLADRIDEMNGHIRELFDMPCRHCRVPEGRVA
jgi:hypothetical protein